MCNGEDHFAGLKNHFGTPTPIWRYSNHDHVLTLSATGDELDGPAIPIHMTGREAERIRGLTGATSMVTLNLPIYGEHVDLYLVGKRIRADEWAGIAASLWDPESVASITMRAMAFSEGLVSETNAILVVWTSAARSIDSTGGQRSTPDIEKRT